MIVESSVLTTVGVGTARSQTEAGDTALKLPNIVLPVIELQDPTQVAVDINAAQATSFFLSRFISRTNSISAALTICTLAKGLWHLSIDYSLKTLYAAPIPFNTNSNIVRVVSPPGGVSANLLSLNPIQSGYLSKSKEIQFLLQESAQIVCLVDATGAADFLDTNVEIVARRLL